MIARLLISSSPKNLNVNLNHPDTLYFKSGEKLGITQAKKIIEHFSFKPYSAKGRSVVIEDASVMTEEAQNALLKTLEELPEEAVFIMCSPTVASFLPTVLSRCEIIKVKSQNSKGKSEDIEKLLNATTEERFEYIEKAKNREEILYNLLAYFRKNLPEYPDFTKKLLEAEKWHKQNVNIRAILEYLMLVMPTPR